MNSTVSISNTSLLLAFALVLISLVISYSQQLEIGKSIITAVLRSIVQLTIVGYLLKYIFKVNDAWITGAFIIIIMFNAALNTKTKNKAQNIPHTFRNSLIAIVIGTTITLSILVLSGAIKFIPRQVIPFGGMIASNIMGAITLCYKNLSSSYNDNAQQVDEMLALGATAKQASIDILRDSIKTGMIPTLNSAKTNGIVALPGMMSGLIIAGTDPVIAIKYQIMVTFMLVGATGISSVIASFLAYREFFNKRIQLI